MMACFQMGRSGLSPPGALRSGRRYRAPAVFVRCRVEESSSDSGGGDEAPESLFMKELKRRGMTPTLLMEETKRGAFELEEAIEENGSRKEKSKKTRNRVASAENVKGTEDQRERSMALNSEGLEGLIPRAKLLLTIGGTFFLGFWPLILITVASFGALYLYFGKSFVHDAGKLSISPPPYVDPYELLEDERISHIAPRLD